MNQEDLLKGHESENDCADENITIDLHDPANHGVNVGNEKEKEKEKEKEGWVFHDLESQFEKEEVGGTGELDEHVAYQSIYAEMVHYNTNYTVKQLHQIMEYYGLKTAQLKKQDCIEHILLFENDEDNWVIVNHRRSLWNYLYILKTDPYTKRFIIGF
jgi:hypothetical protein